MLDLLPSVPPPGVTYCSGLLFCNNSTRVALIRKNKPSWMAGKLNAVGGKVEPGETVWSAMQREWLEETATPQPGSWKLFLRYDHGPHRVHFFSQWVMGDFKLADNQPTAERVNLYFVHEVLAGIYPMIQNLRWIIPLALDHNTTAIASDISLPAA